MLIREDIKLLIQEVGFEKALYKELNNSLAHMTKRLLSRPTQGSSHVSFHPDNSISADSLKTPQKQMFDCEELERYYNTDRLASYIQLKYDQDVQKNYPSFQARKILHPYSKIDMILSGNVLSIPMKRPKQEFEKNLFKTPRVEFAWLKFFVKYQTFLKKLPEYIAYHSEICKLIGAAFGGKCPKELFEKIQIKTLANF
jgi:hypothetical protein